MSNNVSIGVLDHMSVTHRVETYQVTVTCYTESGHCYTCHTTDTKSGLLTCPDNRMEGDIRERPPLSTGCVDVEPTSLAPSRYTHRAGWLATPVHGVCSHIPLCAHTCMQPLKSQSHHHSISGIAHYKYLAL